MTIEHQHMNKEFEIFKTKVDSYSLEQLKEIYNSINKEKYPLRYSLLKEILEKKGIYDYEYEKIKQAKS